MVAPGLCARYAENPHPVTPFLISWSARGVRRIEELISDLLFALLQAESIVRCDHMLKVIELS